MQIIKIDPSEKKDKRFIVTLDDGRKFDFGLLINDLIPSPALFSTFLLWGPSTNLEENIKHLNNLMSRKR